MFEGEFELLLKAPDASLGEAHRWADWVELSCLGSLDRVLGFSDVASLLGADENQASSFAGLLGGVQDGDESDDEVGGQVPGEDYADLLTVHPRPTDGAKRADKRHVLAADLLRILRRRAFTHGSDYPFTVEGVGEETELLVREQPSAGARSYVFLLLCSALSSLDRSTSSALTTAFERVSAIALKNMIPTSSVAIFGTSANSSSRYAGSLRQKVERLAEDLGETPGPRVASLPKENVGDFGLDVVGVHAHGDTEPGRLTVFLQAACTEEWDLKQNTCKADAWDRTINLLSPQVPVCSIPFSFRDAAGRWHDVGRISRTLLLDRARLLHHLRSNIDGEDEDYQVLGSELPTQLIDHLLQGPSDDGMRK